MKIKQLQISFLITIHVYSTKINQYGIEKRNNPDDEEEDEDDEYMNVGGKAEDEDDPVMRKTNFSCSIICICMKHLQHFFSNFQRQKPWQRSR